MRQVEINALANYTGLVFVAQGASSSFCRQYYSWIDTLCPGALQRSLALRKAPGDNVKAPFLELNQQIIEQGIYVIV
jgi:hypothetical protein